MDWDQWMRSLKDIFQERANSIGNSDILKCYYIILKDPWFLLSFYSQVTKNHFWLCMVHHIVSNSFKVAFTTGTEHLFYKPATKQEKRS